MTPSTVSDRRAAANPNQLRAAVGQEKSPNFAAWQPPKLSFAEGLVLDLFCGA